MAESIFQKISRVYNQDGFSVLIKKIIQKPFHLRNSKRIEKMLSNSSSKREVFDEIYRVNYWGSTESASGGGSTLRYTENLRAELEKLIKDREIRSIVDASCGDFNWMKLVVQKTEIDYCGLDIVKDLINRNQEKYSNERTRFAVADICKDTIPDCDLLIVRDVLFHFSFSDTNDFLNNIRRTNYKYLLTTTYDPHDTYSNRDIKTGDFRIIDLFSPPYQFPKDKVELNIGEPPEYRFDRSMVLLRKSDVPTSLDLPT